MQLQVTPETLSTARRLKDMSFPMKSGLLAVLVILPILLQSAGADSTTSSASYTAINPWTRFGVDVPDCIYAGPVPDTPRVGLGGACFSMPNGTYHYRVTLNDDVWGLGFAEVGLCGRMPDGTRACYGDAVCNGTAEGDTPINITSITVTVHDYQRARLDGCDSVPVTWVPTHGQITLELTPK